MYFDEKKILEKKEKKYIQLSWCTEKIDKKILPPAKKRKMKKFWIKKILLKNFFSFDSLLGINNLIKTIHKFMRKGKKEKKKK